MIKVSIDTTELSKFLKFVASDHLPFASARALTWVAKEAQLEIKRNLPRQFMLENKWTEQGVRITPANKADLTSEVYFKDDYMVKQEDAATLTPRGKYIAVPASSKGQPYVKTRSGHIKAGLKPKDMLSDPKRYFVGDIKGAFGIWQRTGAKDAKGWNRPYVNLMYLLTPQGKIPKAWEFGKVVGDIAVERLPRLFSISLNDALKNAK